MAKRKNSVVLIIIALIIVISLATFALKQTGSASITGVVGGNCQDVKFVNQGKSYSDFNSLRNGENINYPDDVLLQAGYKVKTDGVYATICQ